MGRWAAAIGFGVAGWASLAHAEVPVETQAVSEVVVTGAKTLAAGQVAQRTRLGVLGDLDTFDTPFSTTSVTDQFIRDRLARSISDVVASDASVRAASSRYQESESLAIRGFPVYAGNTLFDGLPGLIDDRQPSLDGVARIDIFKGPSALLNNGAQDVGGTINFVPKRAQAEPTRRIVAGYDSDAEGELHLDLGQRFGQDDAFGARLGLGGRYGDTPVDNQRERAGVATLALDHRSDRLRASLDLNAQDRRLLANLSTFSVAPGVPVPRAPGGDLNVFDRSSSFEKHDLIAVGQAEYDLTSRVTLFAAYGHRRAFERYRGPYSPTIVDAAGGVTATVTPYARSSDTDTFRTGVRAAFDTGPVHHGLTLSYEGQYDRSAGGYAAKDRLSTNLYAPVALAPAVPAYGDAPYAYTQNFDSVSQVAADVMSLAGDRVVLIAGARRQELVSQSRDYTTRELQSRYDKTKTTPAVALAVKPFARLTLYGNYIQTLQQGPTAPVGTVNANQVFPPSVAEQYEAGAKYDLGRIGLTFAAFDIRQPAGVSTAQADGTLRFSVEGQQRNRGLEWSAFGEVVKGVRLIGGLSLIDARQTRTEGGLYDGRRAPGVPRTQLNLDGEWDVPGVPGLTLTGRAIHTSREAVDLANTQRIPGWTRYDLGARYAVNLAGRPVTARLSLENVADRAYWASALGGGLAVAAPRTVLASLETRF